VHGQSASLRFFVLVTLLSLCLVILLYVRSLHSCMWHCNQPYLKKIRPERGCRKVYDMEAHNNNRRTAPKTMYPILWTNRMNGDKHATNRSNDTPISGTKRWPGRNEVDITAPGNVMLNAKMITKMMPYPQEPWWAYTVTSFPSYWQERTRFFHPWWTVGLSPNNAYPQLLSYE
jgi:hypothetical protein